MQLTYTLTLSDYKAAIKLHNRQNLGRRLSNIFAGRILPGIGLFLLIAEAFLAFSENDYLSRNPPGLLIVPFIFALLPIIQANIVRKQFDQLFPPSSRNLSIDLDNERIICDNPGSSESKFLWTIVQQFAQDDKVTMLYISKLRFLFFPTNSMSIEQRTELNELVARNMVRKEK